MELLREICELMEAAVEIIEAKKKERQQKSKDAKREMLLQKKGKDLHLHAMQALQGKQIVYKTILQNMNDIEETFSVQLMYYCNMYR